MKNKKLFFKIYIPFAIIIILSFLILQILGSQVRAAYLSDFKFLYNNDLYNNDYIYNFRIRYYDKTFRNSDIFEVYIETNSLPRFIKEVRMYYKGSPFWILISDKLITEEKIDNVSYVLKVKSNLFAIISSILLIILITVYFNEIINLYEQFQTFYNCRLKEYKIVQFLDNNAVNLFILLYAYISFPIINNHLINNGLDASWSYFINKAVYTNFKFGRDIIFTYGHLGYLINPLNIGDNILFSFIFKFVVYVINVSSVYILIKRELNFYYVWFIWLLYIFYISFIIISWYKNW